MSCAATHTDRDPAPATTPPAVRSVLWEALARQIQALGERMGLSCQCGQDIADDVPGPAPSLVADMALIVQEMLLNVARHAHANVVQVRIRASHSDLSVLVKDNGRGAPPSAFDRPDVGGVALMRERAQRLGGWLHISSHLGQGTQLILSLPYDRLSSLPNPQPT